MFGTTKRRGLFGNGIVATPEQEAESARLEDYFRGRGFPIGQAPQETPSPVQGSFGIGGTINPEAQPTRKTGFFGQGGAGRAIAGTIGDVLLQRGGLAPIYAPTMKARQESLLAEQEREAEFAAWQRKEQWKRDNPEARVNDTEADYNFWQSKLTPEQFEQWKRNRYNPPVWRQGDDGRFYQMETATADAPETLPRDFDFGGPSQPATGGFPRR